MNRVEFEKLRDLPQKVINEDIYFTTSKQNSVFKSNRLVVTNAANAKVFIDIKYNPDTGYFCLNTCVEGIGAICRLERNSHEHGNAGRDHKHSLQKPNCPDNNLPHAEAFPNLQGKNVEQMFRMFCKVASITYNGTFHEPNNTRKGRKNNDNKHP